MKVLFSAFVSACGVLGTSAFAPPSARSVLMQKNDGEMF